MKKTLAILLALAMVFSTLTVAFAEDSIGADAQACVTLTMLQGEGKGVTADYLAKTPTRLQAAIMVLRLKGLEDEALAYTGTDNFADVDQEAWAGGKAIMGYLKTHPELGWVGDQGKFNPNGFMNAKDYYKVMLETLGYKQNTTEVIGDFTYPGVLEFAATKGLTKVATVTNFTNNDVAIATIEALKANVKGAEKTLATSLVDAGILTADLATKAGVYTPAAAKFEVTNVKADNLKTVVVTFSKAIDKDSITASTVKFAENSTNISLTLDTNLFVSADKKTMVIVNSATQSDNLKVTIDGLKSADGDKITEYTKTVVATDVTFPSIDNAVALNAKQIEVSFSEPVVLGASTVFDAYEDITVDGDVIVATVTPDYVNNKVVFGLPTALKTGSHKIALAEIYDYANFKAADKEFSFVIGDDTTAPEIVAAEAVDVNTVRVTFSEPLDVVGTFEVNDQAGITATPVANSNNTKYDLTGFTPLTLSAIVQVKVEYVDQEDVVGNAVSAQKTFIFKVADDTTLPTVKAEVGDGNELTLTFSKSMDPALGTITIEDADENQTVLTVSTLAADWDANSNHTVLVIDAATAALDDLNPQNVKVTVEDMKDATIRANLLPDTTITLAVADTQIPTIYSYYKVASGVANGTTIADDTITFYFSEKMDLDTMKNLSNYVGSTVNSLATVSGAAVKSVAADQKSITIKVNDIYAKSATETFTVYAIKDAAGNMMAATSSIAIVPGGNVVSIKSVESTDGTKVKVTFDGVNIASVSPAALKVVLAADSTTTFATFTSASAITYDALADESYVTFTTNRSLGTNPELYDVAILNGSLVKDVYGTALTVVTLANITDGVAPTVKVATGDNTGEIKLTFSEDVTAGTLTDLGYDLIVRDENGTLVTLDDTATTGNLVYYVDGATTGASVTNFDKLVIKGTSGKKYTVQVIGRNIVDQTEGNAVTDLAATAVTVK